MPFDQLFSGKVDTSGSAAPSSTTAAASAQPATSSTGQDQSGGIGSYVPPLVKNIGAGVVQGAVMDPIATFAPVGAWLERNIPGIRTMDEWTGITPENLQAQGQQYQQQYGSSDAAAIGRLGGNVLAGAAIPGAGEAGDLVGGLGTVGRFLAPAARGAYAGATGSALTSGGYGENPLVAGAEGALGGAVIGRLLPGMGGANTDLQGLADRLGIKLTGGQSQGGILQTVEDLSKRLPLSGAASKEAAQKSQMVQVLERNMGVAKPDGYLDLPEIGAAKTAAGSDMSRLANNITIDGSAPAGPAIPGSPAAPDLMTTLNNIVANHSTLGTGELDYKAARYLRDAVQTSLNNNGGVMPGTDFAKLIANGGTLDGFAGHDNSQVRNVAAAVRSALFNAADNTTGNPAGIMSDFRNAQLRYKAAATAADAIGPTGSSEQMTPQGLKLAINRHYADQMINPNATGPGYDMPDLSRLIRGIPKLASSGTAERLSLMNMLGIGGAGSGVLGALSGPVALSTAAHAALPYAAIAGAGQLSRRLPWSQISRATAPLNPLLPRIAGQGVGRVISGNALSPSP